MLFLITIFMTAHAAYPILYEISTRPWLYELSQKYGKSITTLKGIPLEEFDTIKAPYMDAVLDSVPAHLRKVKEYELQFLFHSDGWFLLHCIVTLLNNGKLKPPTEGQKKALTTLIVQN